MKIDIFTQYILVTVPILQIFPDPSPSTPTHIQIFFLSLIRKSTAKHDKTKNISTLVPLGQNYLALISNVNPGQSLCVCVIFFDFGVNKSSLRRRKCSVDLMESCVIMSVISKRSAFARIEKWTPKCQHDFKQKLKRNMFSSFYNKFSRWYMKQQTSIWHFHADIHINI